MKRAAFYLRVSTLDQHPETQLCDLQQLAQQRGWNVVSQYRDHGISGVRVRRPALDEMLADARRGHFDLLAVWSRTRAQPDHRESAGRHASSQEGSASAAGLRSLIATVCSGTASAVTA